MLPPDAAPSFRCRAGEPRCDYRGTVDELATHADEAGYPRCSVDGCSKNAEYRRSSNGMCSMHRARWLRHGNLDGKRPRIPLDERFAKYVALGDPDECWTWIGGANDKGYGIFHVGIGNPVSAARRQVYAHRWAYFQANGSITVGMEVCHRCDNPPCVNPKHLFLGTTKDNAEDKVRKGRSRRPTCRKGHEWTPDNTREFIDTRGYLNRRCRRCRREGAQG